MPSALTSTTRPPLFAAIRLSVPVGILVKNAGVVSSTVIVKSPWAVAPSASVTEQWTEVAPSAKVLPLTGVQAPEAVRSPSSRSLADTLAEKSATAPALLVASTVKSLGRGGTGGGVAGMREAGVGVGEGRV